MEGCEGMESRVERQWCGLLLDDFRAVVQAQRDGAEAHLDLLSYLDRVARASGNSDAPDLE